MSWVVELLHRDGSVLARVLMPTRGVAGSPDAAQAIRNITIGRALDNDLVLDDPHCAAHHARLEVTEDGAARLFDLGTRNGIVSARNNRAAVFNINSDEPFRLGHTLIRIRSSDWPMAAERLLSRLPVLPFALLGFVPRSKSRAAPSSVTSRRA